MVGALCQRRCSALGVIRWCSRPAGLIGISLFSLLIPACSSSNQGALSGAPSHVSEPIEGTYSAFIKKSASHAQFAALLTKLRSLHFSYASLGTENGVLVVGLARSDSTPTATRTLFDALIQDPAVDYVDIGGCDLHQAACASWYAPAASSTSP